MSGVIYREAVLEDVPAMARIRAPAWESEHYWTHRIAGYMEGRLHPQKALAQRVIYLALENDATIGFVAGHLTRRYDCEGELEWIDVISERRRRGIGSEMARLLARWFIQHSAHRICVDPGNPFARRFYAQLGAESLNQQWMFWPDISILLRPASAGASNSEC